MRLKPSFVDVNEEPLHQEVFKNAYIRIYRAILKPGIRTHFHRHSMNTVYVALRGGNISTEKMQGTPSCPTVLAESLSLSQRFSLLFQKIFYDALNIDSGFIFYIPSKRSPVIHRATASHSNNDNMVLLGIEILYSNGSQYRAIEHYGKIEIETDEIIAYRIYVNSNQELDGRKMNSHGIIIVLSGKIDIAEKGQCISLSAGDYYWALNESMKKIENRSLEQVEILYILLK